MKPWLSVAEAAEYSGLSRDKSTRHANEESFGTCMSAGDESSPEPQGRRVVERPRGRQAADGAGRIGKKGPAVCHVESEILAKSDIRR